ncbi:MAG: HAMP domain-containing histidine kinase [Luteimonas sp.]|nr:HAMP domain-containing histidine kinase [Luteimonas sp.]
MVFSPVGALIGEPRNPVLATTVAIAYLPMALVLMLGSRHDRAGMTLQALIGIAIDVTVAALITRAIPGAAPGVAMMLLFNVGAAALLLGLPLAMAVASAATVAVVGEYVWTRLGEAPPDRPLAEVLMFSVSFFAMATVSNLLGRQVRETHALASRHSADAANLAEINGLIIRRMRTGVLLVDGGGFVRLANESALMLLGEIQDANDKPRRIGEIAPELGARLQAWRKEHKADDTPIIIKGDAGDDIEVLPRFARLLADGSTTLVFLDDTTLVSRRAESLTLAAMGRFSASLAHEIRNPLAAISYATQLLEESHDLTTADRRLLQIIHQQCLRTNGIVESVLGLARRERAKPEHIDLVIFVRGFIEDYRLIVPEDNAQLRMTGRTAPLPVMFDPRHLQQILTALVNNAVRYGHIPGEKPRIAIHLEQAEDRPVVSVLDRGPGIPDAVAAQLFRPFFTTSENGTGLGLYIAKELSRANESVLDYVAVPGGGACFRIVLPAQHALMAG